MTNNEEMLELANEFADRMVNKIPEFNFHLENRDYYLIRKMCDVRYRIKIAEYHQKQIDFINEEPKP